MRPAFGQHPLVAAVAGGAAVALPLGGVLVAGDAVLARPVGGQRVGSARRARDHAHRDAAEALADLVELGVDQRAVREVAAAAHQHAGLGVRRGRGGVLLGHGRVFRCRVHSGRPVRRLRAGVGRQAERAGPLLGVVDRAELPRPVQAGEHGGRAGLAGDRLPRPVELVAVGVVALDGARGAGAGGGLDPEAVVEGAARGCRPEGPLVVEAAQRACAAPLAVVALGVVPVGDRLVVGAAVAVALGGLIDALDRQSAVAVRACGAQVHGAQAPAERLVAAAADLEDTQAGGSAGRVVVLGHERRVLERREPGGGSGHRCRVLGSACGFAWVRCREACAHCVFSVRAGGVARLVVRVEGAGRSALQVWERCRPGLGRLAYP